MNFYRNADVKTGLANRQRKAGTTWILGAVSAALVASASHAASVAVDVGNMKVMTDPSQPLKIALFLPALVTPYLQANLKGAQDEAAKTGATVSVFDAKADPMNQLNQ